MKKITHTAAVLNSDRVYVLASIGGQLIERTNARGERCYLGRLLGARRTLRPVRAAVLTTPTRIPGR